MNLDQMKALHAEMIAKFPGMSDELIRQTLVGLHAGTTVARDLEASEGLKLSDESKVQLVLLCGSMV